MGQYYWSEECDFVVDGDDVRGAAGALEGRWDDLRRARSFLAVGDDMGAFPGGLAAAMAALGFAGHEGPGGSWVMDGWDADGAYGFGDAVEDALAAMAPYVRGGSWVVACADDWDGPWEWDFDGEAMSCEEVSRPGRDER